MATFYSVLGVKNDASEDQIGEAYREVAGRGVLASLNLDPRVALANQAHRVLMDSQLRHEYDDVLVQETSFRQIMESKDMRGFPRVTLPITTEGNALVDLFTEHLLLQSSGMKKEELKEELNFRSRLARTIPEGIVNAGEYPLLENDYWKIQYKRSGKEFVYEVFRKVEGKVKPVGDISPNVELAEEQLCLEAAYLITKIGMGWDLDSAATDYYRLRDVSKRLNSFYGGEGVVELYKKIKSEGSKGEGFEPLEVRFVQPSFEQVGARAYRMFGENNSGLRR